MKRSADTSGQSQEGGAHRSGTHPAPGSAASGAGRPSQEAGAAPGGTAVPGAAGSGQSAGAARLAPGAPGARSRDGGVGPRRLKLTILGGGGFRVPLVYRALLGDRGEGRVTDVALYDLDAARLATIARVLADQAGAAGHPDPPAVTATTDLDEAVTGADFVFSAIRVGGLAGRAADERIALEEGVLGQETTGAGGVSYGLRTMPVVMHIARRIRELAPDAWVINFTNPAGMVTEAMTAHLGDRVIGICDSPVGLGRRVAGALGVDPARARLDYVGLNHLGWLRGLYVDGRDILPRLFEDEGALTSFEEGKLFGADLLRTIGALPNEYLHYYYYNREAVASARAAEHTRGAFLHTQQQRFYASCDAGWNAWDATRLERETTYMAENRDAVGMGERDSGDLESGGYEQVALALMRAIALDERTTLILNVPGRGRIRQLDDEAVVEVPCHVDANGARPIAGAPLPDHGTGLVCSVKAVERAVIHAATTGERAAAVRALTIHPLIDSYAAARRLLDAYRRHFPELSYLEH
jgi:6-phospho-beta-glucosidase